MQKAAITVSDIPNLSQPLTVTVTLQPGQPVQRFSIDVPAAAISRNQALEMVQSGRMSPRDMQTMLVELLRDERSPMAEPLNLEGSISPEGLRKFGVDQQSLSPGTPPQNSLMGILTRQQSPTRGNMSMQDKPSYVLGDFL